RASTPAPGCGSRGWRAARRSAGSSPGFRISARRDRRSVRIARASAWSARSRSSYEARRDRVRPARATRLTSAGVVVAFPCGGVYELRPEYAGRLLECPACGRPLRAGPPPGTFRPAALQGDAAFDREVFLLRERVLTI